MRQSEINGESERRPALPPVRDDGLYRYVPVPPVYRDDDGYPVEDGMSQAIDHQRQTAHWSDVLQRRYPEATVASDLTMPYKRGDITKVLVPDLFVALRAERRNTRTSYRLWENPLPDLVMEMLSKKTSEADIGSKWRTYEYLGVREYWLFDPEGFELSTPLVGHRMWGGRYRQVRANAAGRLPSRVLGLELHVQDGKLRFRDPETDEDLATYDGSEDGRLAEKRRADKAEEGRAAAEEDRAVERRRADEAEEGRAAERRRADEAEARAEEAEEGRVAAEEGRAAERRRAEEAERELVRLRQLLR